VPLPLTLLVLLRFMLHLLLRLLLLALIVLIAEFVATGHLDKELFSSPAVFRARRIEL